MAKSANERTIWTTFYQGKKIVQVNRSFYADRAVENCFVHMHRDKYGADRCEVYDHTTGKQYASIKVTAAGKFIVFVEVVDKTAKVKTKR